MIPKRVGRVLVAGLLAIAIVAPSALADDGSDASDDTPPVAASADTPPNAAASDTTVGASTSNGGTSTLASTTVVSPAPSSHISAADPMNGGFLILNMHGMLFHPDTSDIAEDINYARWLGGGVIRVFGTDSSGDTQWDGTRVGARIAEIAPLLRASHQKLIVAFVNNHKAVPGEAAGSAGWMDNYMQLLLPFYTDTWRGAYLKFVRDLITTVQSNNAQDVVYAWELGNELHTPVQPDALKPFITEAAADVRALDPVTPILPGTMGANHVEPGRPSSEVARWLYCEAPVDAYTLHAYDWVSRQRPGDMPIDWDLDNILSQPCPNGRALPVIVEELGTSRTLVGMYSADDENARLQQEQRQIAFVRQFPEVLGWGVWNAESPRLVDRTFVDTRRGLTSYGSKALGGGSCYDPTPDPTPGARCQLEQLLRGSHFVRVGASDTWTPGLNGQGTTTLAGGLDPVTGSDTATNALTLTGWVADPAAAGGTGITSVDVLGTDASTLVASAQIGITRGDVAAQNQGWASAGFSVSLPLAGLPPGADTLTLVAHTASHGTWLSSFAVVVPSLGGVPSRAPVVQVAPPPPPPTLHAEVQSPQSGDDVGRTFIVQVLTQGADRVDVYLEPDRDHGGHLVGSATVPNAAQSVATSVKITVSAPLDGHTLYVHVSSSATRQEQVLTVPVVVVRS